MWIYLRRSPVEDTLDPLVLDGESDDADLIVDFCFAFLNCTKSDDDVLVRSITRSLTCIHGIGCSPLPILPPPPR